MGEYAESDYLAHDDVPIPAQCIHMRGCDCKRPETVEQIKAERDRLAAAVERVEALMAGPEWHIEVAIGGSHYVNDQLRAALSDAIDAGQVPGLVTSEKVAEAWDACATEAFERGLLHDAFTEEMVARNPYREQPYAPKMNDDVLDERNAE